MPYFLVGNVHGFGGQVLIPSDDGAGRSGALPDACGGKTIASEASGSIVVIRQDLLATLDHSFGNLFQRLYHLLRSARGGEQQALPALEGCVRQLQAVLELFVDYVTPMTIEVQVLRCSDLCTSLRRHLHNELGLQRFVIEEGDWGEVSVAVDPARLSRVFQLLAGLLARSLADTGEVGRVRSLCRLSADQSHLEIVTQCPVSAGTADGQMCWALAEKLVELHGGALRETTTPEGATWTLQLPTTST